MKQKLLNKLLTLALLTLGGVINPAWADNVTYDFTQISGFSSWGTSYSSHSVTYDESTVTFTSANKQTSTITNQPVTKGQPVTLVMKEGYTISAATFACTQWGTKAQTITLHYSTDGGENYTSTGVTSTNFTITKNGLPSGTNAVKITFSSSSNQVGIASATITYSAPVTTHTLTYSATNGSIAGVDAESSPVASGSDVAEGATVTLTATPSSGYVFSSWDVSGTGSTLSSTSTNPTTFTMGTANSTVTANFVSAPSVATPTFSVAAGTYTSDQSVTISTATEDASIYYTTNGDTPTSSSTLYSSAVTVSESMTIKAIAIKAGMADSEVASAEYTINKPTPELSFSEDSYDASLGSEFSAPTLTNTNSVSPITYSSSDTGVATVDEFSGAIALVGEGSTTITASFAGNSTYAATEASYTLNVSDPAVATTVTISDAGITDTDVYVSTTAGSFTATVKDNEDETVGGAAVTWSSSDESVATINASTGVVTLVAAGTTTITATYAGVAYTYQGSSSTYELTVTSSAPITDETFTFSELRYVNGASVTTVDGAACTLTFDKGTNNSNVPKYYSDGTSVRAYGGNTFTVSSDSKTIKKIELTFGSGDGSNTITTNIESYSDGTWTGSASSVIFTIGGSSGNRRISAIKVYYDNRVASDLTKTNDITLDFKGGDTNADLTGFFTTSSTGAITYTVADETVIEIDEEIISALKVGTTTVTVNQAADATYKAGEITINVTVDDTRTPCVTDLGLASAKTILKDVDGDLSVTATKDGSFTGTINYTYVSADEGIFYIDGTEYLGAGVGTTTVTVTATPTGGNAAQYKSVSQEVEVTVNGTNSISLDKTSNTVASGADAFTITATVPTENYDGTVTASSSNTNVATVSVEGTTVTVTPVAVGTATITVTAGTGTYYLSTASENCSVTVTAPEGSEEAPSGVITTSFTDKNLSFSSGGVAWTATEEANSYEARGVQFGAAIGDFTLSTTAISGTITKVSMLVSTNADANKNTIAVTVGGTTFTNGGNNTFSMPKANNQTVEFTGSGSGAIVISCSDNQKSIYFKSITVTIDPSATVTLNKYGYATYCSVNPIDFSSTEGYTAWRVNSIASDGTITFKKITEAIKGGQGVLLYNINANGEKTNAIITFADGTVEFDNDDGDDDNNNYLVGTTAPTNVAAGAVYGLSNDKFVKSSVAGNIPAGKAYILATSIPAGVKAFNFVFEDEADGIRTIENVSAEDAAQIFDLLGRRLNKMQKGINIVNGKKILK